MPAVKKEPRPTRTPPIHPLSRKLAGLLSPLSLKDQKYNNALSIQLIFGSLLGSFPVAYYFDNIFIAVFGIIAGTVVSLVLCLPNWWQQEDGLQWANEDDVKAYYGQLYAARNKAGKSPVAK